MGLLSFLAQVAHSPNALISVDSRFGRVCLVAHLPIVIVLAFSGEARHTRHYKMLFVVGILVSFLSTLPR